MTIIRTKTKATGGITPQEQAQMALVAQDWIKIAMRTDPIMPEKIIPAIEGIYVTAKLKKPKVIIVPSPLVLAFAYGASAWILHCRKNNTRAATDAATYAATRAATRAATGAATDAATYAATRAATGAATDAATDAATACFDMAGEGGLECAKRWYASYQGGNMWAAWCAYLSAFRDVLDLELPEYINYAHYEQAAKEGGFRVMHEDFCMVSDFPEFIKTDDQNRPHCADGASHLWRDGWELYHWHGVAIPGEWVTGKKPSAKDALTWKNIEQRRAACEIVGWNSILSELNARIIDTDDDAEIGQLLETEIPDSGMERFLKVRCGTGRDFVLPVPREMQTALEANAWTYGLDKISFKPEVRT